MNYSKDRIQEAWTKFTKQKYFVYNILYFLAPVFIKQNNILIFSLICIICWVSKMFLIIIEVLLRYTVAISSKILYMYLLLVSSSYAQIIFSTVTKTARDK